MTELRLSNSPADGFPKSPKIPDPQPPSTNGLQRVLRLTQPPIKGNDVRKVQEALVTAGISIVIDGIFGPATDKAVKKFQERKGLSIDGVVGTATRKALGLENKLIKLQEIVQKNQAINLDTLTADKELVREIQSRLNAIGLLQLFDVDGIFGPITKAALISFCDAVFLNNMNTGLFGKTFFQKLMNVRGILVPSLQGNPPDSLPANVETALKFTLKWEGGFVNNPFDIGGATNKGITQRTYDTYRINKGLATKNVEFILDAEVREIYYEMYWKPCQAELMVLPLAVVQFDTAVLFGVTGAILFLQEELGVSADGIFGRQTEAALRSSSNRRTVANIIEARIAYHNRRVREDRRQGIFLQGWINRANNLKEFIKNM